MHVKLCVHIIKFSSLCKHSPCLQTKNSDIQSVPKNNYWGAEYFIKKRIL